jgi:probable F420-dependent oxidoreductase
MLRIGFEVRTPGLVSDPAALLQVLTEGERMGFDYTTLSDHIVSPVSIETTYPYNAAGKLSPVAAGGRHELLTAIAFFAAKTSRLRFVTAVMVVPYRPPILTAKILSTIDSLSGGRLTVGVGTGWMKDEFDAIAAPDFRARGDVTDDYIEVMKTLWTDEEPKYEGDHARVSGITFAPKPAQTPHPPLWVGGLSNRAMRRAARLGDAWYPVPTDQARPLDSLPRMREGIARMRAMTAEAGRDPESVTVAVRGHEFGEGLPPTASDGERRLFSGTASEIARDLAAARDLGVTSIDFRFTRQDVGQALEDMATFQRDVVASL